MLKRFCSLILTMIILTSFTYKDNNKNISLNCIAATVIDQESGRILYSKNGNMILPMASTTKIITSIVALEKGKLQDIVIISKRAATIHGSTVGLKEGEKYTLEELLYGLMMKSGNDCAIAIAEHIGGNIEKFVKLMNDKAVELGAYNTSFVTPHGLDADNHFTTAEDLAKITAYAMSNPMFAKIVSTKQINKGISGDFNKSYNNINKFLYKVDNSDGVKTGYTGNAGKCLVASVKHKYGRYICVVLNSGSRWKDAEKLTEYAEKNYKYIKILNRNEALKRFRVYGGKQKYITGVIRKDLFLPLRPEEFQKYSLQIYAPSVMFSPIYENEKVGNVVVNLDDKVIAKYPVLSDRDITRRNSKSN